MDESQSERKVEPFAMVPTTVLRDPALSVYAKILFAILTTYANPKTSKCWPSMRRLSADAGCSKRTCQRAVSELESRGLIACERRTEDGSNEPASNLYQITGTAPQSPRSDRDSLPTAGQSLRVAQDSHEVVTEVPVGDDCESPESYQEKYTNKEFVHVSKKRSKQPVPYTFDFELFWQAYPRREGKRSAWRQWQARLRTGATADEMIAGAKAYASKVEKDGRETKFTKLPATFLGPDLHFSEVIDATAQPVEQMTWARPQLFVKGAQT